MKHCAEPSSQEKKEIIVAITLDDLKKQYTDISALKERMENDYYRVLGQLSLLKQQIESLEKRSSDKEK